MQLLKLGKAAIAKDPSKKSKRLKSLIQHGLKSDLRRGALWLPGQQRKFWDRVAKTSTCWLWISTIVHGYGQFTVNGVSILAHRYAFILANGPVPSGLHLHHKCEVKNCVNPDHAQALTPLEHKAAHAATRAAHIAPAVHECFMEEARRTR